MQSHTRKKLLSFVSPQLLYQHLIEIIGNHHENKQLIIDQ